MMHNFENYVNGPSHQGARLARISHRFLLNGCNLLGNKELWDSEKTVCLFGSVQQKPQNDKRARRRYRCDPLGHVHEHAPGADLALSCLASLLEFVRHPG